MTLFDADTGKELARGKHVKYMPMGLAWDIAFSSVGRPLAQSLLNNKIAEFEKKAQMTPITASSDNKSGSSTDKETGSMFLDAFTASEDGSQAEAGRAADIWGLLNLVDDNNETAHAAVAECQKQHCNPLGTMHGGCIAMVSD